MKMVRAVVEEREPVAVCRTHNIIYLICIYPFSPHNNRINNIENEK